MVNNRKRGISWEIYCVNQIKHIFPRAVSSRSESRNRDAQKVDMCHTGDFNFQCKTQVHKPKYDEILKEMPQENKINVIFHNFTRKSKKNFVSLGHYAILKMEDFIKILENYVGKEN